MGNVSGGRRRAFRSRHHTPMGKGGRLAVIFVCSALVLFVLAVMLGNYLRGLAEDITDNTAPEQSTNAGLYYANPPADMIGRGIRFGFDYFTEGTEATDETVDVSQSAEVSAGGDASAETSADTEAVPAQPAYNAVSVTLRTRDRETGKMHLAYNSPITERYFSELAGDTALAEGMDIIRRNWGERIRICGVFEIGYLSEPEDTRDMIRAYETALLCELADAGFDEMLLLGFSDDHDEGLAFISDIYEKKGRDMAIGLGFSFEKLSSPQAYDIIDAVAKKCGFIALDLCNVQVPALMAPEALIADRISRTEYICNEFSVRILLGCGELPDGDSQTRAALAAGAENVMTGIGLFEN